MVDTYFLEHRAKLIDIAAFLDRVDRAPGRSSRANHAPAATDEKEGKPQGDHRLVALTRALRVLCDGQPNRAVRVLELLSDPTREPIHAPTGQGATGAYLVDQAGDIGETSGGGGEP